MEIGTRLEANVHYGKGVVEALYSEGMMLVRFDDRILPIMCSNKSMSTLHSGPKAKLIILEQENV